MFALRFRRATVFFNGNFAIGYYLDERCLRKVQPEVACYSNVAQCLLKLAEGAKLHQASKLYQRALAECNKALSLESKRVRKQSFRDGRRDAVIEYLLKCSRRGVC